MNARSDDLSRLQEIYDVVMQTKRQMSALGFTKDRFVAPATDADDLIAEGIMNRVLRVTEEAGKLSEDIAVEYGFDRHAVTGGAQSLGPCLWGSGQRHYLVGCYGRLRRLAGSMHSLLRRQRLRPRLSNGVRVISSGLTRGLLEAGRLSPCRADEGAASRSLEL